MEDFISIEMVKVRINAANIVLQECFELLLCLKHSKGNIGEAIMDFQPRLAECLYDLMMFYNNLKSQIRETDALTSSDTANEMCHDLLDVVKDTIIIGKSLGDAYAWFFYRNNRSELDKHLQHKSTGLFTAGFIGGLGELEFIKHTQNLGGLFVLYHGMTDMLRVGDFSTYAVDTGIVGIGELKTRKDGEDIIVTAYITSKYNNVFNKTSNMEILTQNEYINICEANPRLEKQLKTQMELVKASAGNFSSEEHASYEHEILNRLTDPNTLVSNEDGSLILFGAESHGESLFDVLFIKETLENLPEDFCVALDQMLTAGIANNKPVVGHIDLEITSYRMPVFWWDIDDEICRKIYFRKLSIATIYNPAKLLQHFIDDGFSTVDTSNSGKFRIERSYDGKQLEISNFEVLNDLVCQSLMKTQSIFAITKKIINSIESEKELSNTKTRINIQLHSFG